MTTEPLPLTPLELSVTKALRLVADELPARLCMARQCTSAATVLADNDRIVAPLVLELCSRHGKQHQADIDRVFVLPEIAT